MSATVKDSPTQSVVDLPPMPQVAAKVLAALKGQDTTADDLHHIIEMDPAMTASVLRLVNSAMFNLPKQISTLSHAIMLLGFLRLRSLTLATVVAGVKNLVPPQAAEKRDRVWEHSVNTALGARHLAERAGLAWSEEAFVAGLLHDIGRLILLARRPDEYTALMDATTTGMPLPEQEEAVLGENHEQVGAELLTRWNLAPQLSAAVGRHHGNRPTEGEHAALISLVALAERLVDEEGLTEDPQPAAEYLGYSVEGLETMADEIRATVREERPGLLAM